MTSVLLDLGQADVHIPATPKRSDMAKVYTYEFGGKSYECDDGEDSTDMISSEERKSLPGEKFALPEERKYPIDTAARTRNAATRLEQQKGSMSPEKYSKARAAIGHAAKSHGIDSEYNKKTMDGGEHFEPDGDELGGKGDGDEDDKKKEMTAGQTEHVSPIQMAANSGDSKEIWIQIAKQGKFHGHAAGPFEMTARTFAEIIHNFNSQKNRAVRVDFEHYSEKPVHPMVGAPAQGWVTKLEVRDGNLWGLVQWGDLARQYIRAGQYRYISPAIVFGSKDRVSGHEVGARLSSVALTNDPFLDGMQPVAANRSEASVSGDVVRVICNALKLPDYIDARGACMTMRHIENMYGSPPPGVAPNFAASQATALRDALRLPLTMSVTDVFAHARIACGEVSPPTSSAAVQENHQPMNTAKEKVMSENENKETEVSKLTLKLAESQAEVRTLKADTEQKITTLTAENTALKTKVAEFENHQLESRVDMAMQIWGEKKGLSSEMRPHLLTFARTAPESFNAMYPQPAPGQQRPLGRQVASGPHNVPVPQIGAGGIAPEPGGARVIPMHGGAGASPTIEMCLSQVRKEAKEQGIQLDRETEYANAHTLLINLAADKRLAGNGG